MHLPEADCSLSTCWPRATTRREPEAHQRAHCSTRLSSRIQLTLGWLVIQTSEESIYSINHLVKWSEVTQSCPTLCDPMDCSPTGSSVHGILQARILEWGAISFSRGSSQPRDWTRVSHITGRHYNLWATMLNHKSFSTYIHISGPTQKATGHDYAGWLSGHMSWF